MRTVTVYTKSTIIYIYFHYATTSFVRIHSKIATVFHKGWEVGERNIKCLHIPLQSVMGFLKVAETNI